MPRPKYINETELAKVGLKLVQRHPLVVQCQQCGAEWRPQLLRVKHSQGWRCLNGCEPLKQLERGR
jgi:hypothetical protein